MNFNNNCDFEKALLLVSKSFDYDELIELMQHDNIAEKQYAILSINELKTENDGKLLCSNLVGQDGKIRESVAFKLNELFKNNDYAKYLENIENFKIMLEGIMDINGNVCRNILDIDNDKFLDYLSGTIVNKIKNILEDVSKLSLNEKQYVISKRYFQLYWALECLCKVHNKINFKNIEHILNQTAQIEDYTIKEKTAKICWLYKTDISSDLKRILENSNNYFVNRYLCF